ncbi:MAG: hypothetical protein JSR58_04760 [Verrucomicrobia bacterium]|nr:hypothetical protein [Verrucomicrobiota bacterium]
MNKRATTKDELYLLKLHELALRKGDPTTPIDRYEVGKAIGQHDKSVDNIVNLLAQTNFIKKGDGKEIFLTPHGLRSLESFKQ